MTAFLFANNASTTLAAPITSGATSVTLAVGAGSKFPTPGAGQAFSLTLKDSATGENTEIMYCTSRTGDVCTVTRGEEGTTAQNWTTGDFANNTLTAGVASAFLQSAGSLGTMAVQNANAVAITGGSIDVTTLEVGGSPVLVNPATSKGDILVSDASGVLHRLGAGPDGDVLTARSAATLGVDWEAGGGSGTNLSWVIVAGFTDADVATAVAAINASANGGVMYFGPGTWAGLSGGHVFTKPVTMLGCGCADNRMAGAITKIECASATANLFEFNADPWQVRDIHLVNVAGSAPTAGSGIYSSGGNGHRLQNVTTKGFYDNWRVDNASEWFWSACVTYGPVHYGAWVRNVALPDGGDQGIVNVLFYSDTYNAAAGLRFESGGGMRVTNCKWNYIPGGQFVNAIDIEMHGSTVDFFISNSRFGHFTGWGLKARAPSGQLHDIIINGVQFGNYGSTSLPIDLQPASTGVLSRVMINGCDFIAPSSSVSAITLANMDNVTIGPCVCVNHPQLVTATTTTNLVNHNALFRTGTLVDGATIAMDCANYQNFNLTLGGNHTLAIPTNCAPGPAGNIRVHTGGNTLSFASGWKFPGGVAPVLANGANMLTYQYDSVDGTFWVAATAGAFA